MEQSEESRFTDTQNSKNEISIFDDIGPLPVYYSDKAIFRFSIFFGVLFASVLLVMNINSTTDKKGIKEVMLFGVLFTAFQLWFLNYFLPESSSGSHLFFNAVGGLVLQYHYFEKYLGKNVHYEKRSVVVPAIIGIAIGAVLVLMILVPDLLLKK